MNWTTATHAALLLVTAPFAIRPASAQCPGFEAGFHVPGMSDRVRALEQFDDGTGPVLVAGGDFRAAGNVAADRIATWDGTSYAPLGSGLNGIVRALLAFDDGAGPALYAGGLFTASGQQPMDRIARWSGGAWSALGSGLAGEVMTLAVFDDGGGRALYAGGRFPGGIAKWNGSTWSVVGGGLTNGSPTEIFTLAAVDSAVGGPQVLAAGGQFRNAGGVIVDNVAFWNGSVWSSPANGIPGTVQALIGFDDGSGPRVFATGPFGARVWNGTAWNSSPIAQGALTFHVFDDGLGGGRRLHAAGTGGVSRWDGSTWSTLAGINYVLAIHGYDDGTGPKLHAGGIFSPAVGLAAYHVAVLDGSLWRAWDPSGNGLYTAGYSEPLAVHDDGTGRKLYTGGPLYAGSVPAHSVARWEGNGWSGLPSIPGNANGPTVLESWDDGSGSGQSLFASSLRTSSTYELDRWAGGAWTSLATTNSWAETMSVLDDGSGERLFVGGAFASITPTGGAPIACNRVVTWDGASWSPFGSGLNGSVAALASYDDGFGPVIFAAGDLNAPYAEIVRWNGSAWMPVAGGMMGTDPYTAVWDLCVFDDGSGSALYACGRFDFAGGAPAKGIARWDGATWSAVGGSLGGALTACGSMTATGMAVFDDGTGSGAALYVVGNFESAGGQPARGIARWDGVSWAAVGSGFQGSSCTFPHDIEVHDDGDPAGPALWISGSFQTVDGIPSANITRYRGCGSIGEIYCAGDGTSTNCPCGNSSLPGAGEGCVNTSGLGGKLRARGLASTSNDSLVLVGTSMPPNASVLYFQGTARTNGGAGAVFGDGLRCASGSVVRLDIALSSGGASSHPTVGDAPISVTGVCSPGATRHYQVWYRDALTFCTSSTYNLTNGLSIGWQL